MCWPRPSCPSGHVLDDGSGWARLDLYTAAGGYGAFDTDVVVTMNAADGGFSASDVWDNDISGTGGLTKRGSGVLELAGENTYSGQTIVEGGTLTVNGSVAGSVEVQAGGLLNGSGSVGGLTLASGATLAPGNSIGTMQVAGDLTFAEGSVYEVEVDAEGNSDLVDVAGSANLDGSVVALAADGDYAVSTDYTILTADGGINGSFEATEVNFAFLDTSLAYGANDVTLRLDRNDTSFRTVASTGNNRSVATALEALGAGDELHDQLVFADAETADAAFTQLAGELHPSVAGALVEMGNAVDRTIRNRIGNVSGDAATEAGVETARLGDGQLWWQAYGNWAETEGGEASGLDRNATGTLVGFDTETASGWNAGFFAGYGNGSIEMNDVAASAEADSYHLGIYGGTRRGALGLRLGASHSLNRLDTQRRVGFDDRNETLTADYDASTTRVYGEASWRIDATAGGIEPYAALSHVALSSDSFAETGGASALKSDGIDMDTTFSTLGLRADRQVKVGGGQAVLRGELGWQHAFGDIDPLTRLAFAGGNAFDVTGTPIAEDSALLRAGLDVVLAPNATIGVGYAGQFGDGLTDHGVTADLNVRF